MGAILGVMVRFRKRFYVFITKKTLEEKGKHGQKIAPKATESHHGECGCPVHPPAHTAAMVRIRLDN